MLIFILIDAQKAFFSFEEGSHHQNHSSSGKNITPPQHPIKISPKLNFQYPPLGGEGLPPTPDLYLKNPVLQGRFLSFFQFLCCIQRNPLYLISKKLGRRIFLMEQLPIDSYMLLRKQKNYIPIHPHTLSFSFDYIFRLFT